MASLTLTLLRDRVMRRLGDMGYFDTPSTPTKVKSIAAVDQMLNDSIAHHVRIAERMGMETLNDERFLFVCRDENPQIITITGSPTGGTFTVLYFGVESGTIAYNELASGATSVQTKLNAVKSQSLLTVTGSAGGPWTCTYAAGDRPNIPRMSLKTNSLTGGTNPSVTITGTQGTVFPREYDLSHWLVDSSFVPNYRSQLFLRRTDTTWPLNVEWVPQGDHRTREGHSTSPGLGPRWPTEVVSEFVDGSGGTRDIGFRDADVVLYRRGRYLGFVTTPTQNMTFTCSYRPSVPLLVNTSDTMEGTLRMPFFGDYGELLSAYAARQLADDFNLGGLENLEQRYARLMDDFMSGASEAGRLVRPVVTRKWM